MRRVFRSNGWANFCTLLTVVRQNSGMKLHGSVSSTGSVLAVYAINAKHRCKTTWCLSPYICAGDSGRLWCRRARSGSKWGHQAGRADLAGIPLRWALGTNPLSCLVCLSSTQHNTQALDWSAVQVHQHAHHAWLAACVHAGVSILELMSSPVPVPFGTTPGPALTNRTRLA